MQEFAKRRLNLVENLDDALIVIPAAQEKFKNIHHEYRFRQDSHFYYLTGFDEPYAILVLSKKNKEFTSHLFVMPKDPAMELWTGKRLGKDAAPSSLKVDFAYNVDEFDQVFKELVLNHRTLMIDRELVTQNLWDRVMKAWQDSSFQRRGLMLSKQITTAKDKIGQLRLKKSSEEIENMVKAHAITTQAHRAAMAYTSADKFEYQVHALFEYFYRAGGSRGEAYSSIVAGGNNANTLHYVENNARLHNKDMVLIDSGCEFNYYASDVTRTFPVSGKFSTAQREIYEVVLAAQKSCIEMAKPGVLLSQIHDQACLILAQGLKDLGVFKQEAEDILKSDQFKKLFPHSTGHHIGLDTHDAVPYRDDTGNERPLSEGMCFTIEPGLYFNADDDFQSPYKGIGIRIEDDILITKDSHRVLSKDTPKEVKEIEEACAKNYLEFFNS